MKINKDLILKITIGVCIIWFIYKIIDTIRYKEKFVAIGLGSLNDCLTSCAQDKKCLAAAYNPSTNECDMSQRFGEFGGINAYTKKDKNIGNVFIDLDFNEYTALESANARIVDWNLDNKPPQKYSFEKNSPKFYINYTDESPDYDDPPKEKYTIGYYNRNLKYVDDDDFLSI